MKILTGKSIREADRYTIEHRPISSIDLMERAADSIANYLTLHYTTGNPFVVFAGKGNNGADGLAVARLLHKQLFSCRIVSLFPDVECSDEYRVNRSRLSEDIPVEIFDPANPPLLSKNTIILDCMLGTGTVGAAKEPVASAIGFINGSGLHAVSVDMPSGMSTEWNNKDIPIVKADITLALEFPKLSLLLPEAGGNAGEVVVLFIGLSREFMDKIDSPYSYTTEEMVGSFRKKNGTFDYKGTYGHALLICGSSGMMGASILATGGALRSGCGLVTSHVPKEERMAIHCTHPSALLSLDPGTCFSRVPDRLDKFTAIGIGSGMGQFPDCYKSLEKLLKSYRRPMIFDADAINILGTRHEWWPLIPDGSIFTPHLGELKRLIGGWAGEKDKLERTLAFARDTRSYVVIKGAYSAVCCPDGEIHFNSTGNSGMAKGGSGDVLTGLITGLLARGYESKQAAIIGVYVHGEAGDRAAETFGRESMNASDLIDFIGT